MNKKVSTDISRRNHSNELVSAKKNLDVTDQPIGTSVSPFLSARRLIDAKTYVDAQSNGLTSRIVRYDEESKQMGRTFNRLYKRPGDFPIVHLDKPKLILNPQRSVANPSKMARIGQPDPINYQTNIRAEILRNGMLMPQVPADRHEDADGTLGRVDPLDALKEISRKRIHCEDTVHQLPATATEKDAPDSICDVNDSKRQKIGVPSTSPSSNDTNKRGNNSSKCNEILSSLSSSSYMLPSQPQSMKRAKSISPTNATSEAKRIQSEKPNEMPTVDLKVDSVPRAVEERVSKVVEISQPAEPPQTKLTLFNRPYESKKRDLPSSRNDPIDDLGISFVKPRPLTPRSRENVDNWLKIKPDENRRLALMLSCLSGEVDYCDTVDSVDKVKETPAVKTAVVSSDNTLKVVETAEKSIPAAVVSSTSTTISLLPSKPTITFSSNAVTTTTSSVSLVASTTTQSVSPTTTTAQAGPAIETRKGGFSFPLVSKSTALPTGVSSAPSIAAPSTSSVAPTTSSVAPTTSSAPPTTSSVAPVLPTLTPTAIISKVAAPTTSANVTFNFHPPKPTESSSIAPSVAKPTQTFSFGNTATTKPLETAPVFGFSTTVKATAPTTISSANPKTSLASGGTSKPSAFTAGFGTATSASTIPTTTSATSIFGNVTTSNTEGVPQQRAFGSVPTTQRIQGNSTSAFAKNEQAPSFGKAVSNTTSNSATQNAPTASILSNQPVNPAKATTVAPNAPFTFGKSATVSSAFTNTQPTVPSTASFDNTKAVNSSTNIFNSPAPQQPTSTPVFGSSVISTAQTSAEPGKNASAQNIFGSSATKSTPAFSFSANNQSKSNNIFGGQTSTNSTTLNAFGSSVNNFGGSEQKTDVANKPFTFGGNISETTKPAVFGTQAPAFGTDATKSTGFATNNITNTPNLFNTKPTTEVPKTFSFGGNSNTTTAGTTFGGAAIPSFGGTSTFGNTNAATPSFSNSASTFGNTNANSASIFGSTSAPSVFGNSSATPAFGGNNSATSAPVFGSNSTTTPISAFGTSATSTPAFGSTSSTSATPVFGSTNTKPAFGGTSATPSFGGVNAASAFGGTKATPNFGATNTAPAFGASNATPAFGASNATPAFGASTATPSFGASNTTPTFGATKPTPTFGVTTATPTFGATNATPTFASTFGAGGSFGAPTFGATNTNFGGNNIAPAFTTSTGSADVNKTFNFTGTDPAPSPVPNLFNIGPANPSPRGRTIRTATRRNYR
ncbi:Nuclear pore complex protein NUP98A, partial [Pseudolycoriella hygida]